MTQLYILTLVENISFAIQHSNQGKNKKILYVSVSAVVAIPHQHL